MSMFCWGEKCSHCLFPLFLLSLCRGPKQQAIRLQLFSAKGKKQMVNSTEKKIFFYELILIKDVLEALTESWGTGAHLLCGVGEGK